MIRRHLKGYGNRCQGVINTQYLVFCIYLGGKVDNKHSLFAMGGLWVKFCWKQAIVPPRQYICLMIIGNHR